jgi:hypothetical protein
MLLTQLYVRIFILLTPGKDFHKPCYMWGHTTSLTPPRLIEVPVHKQECSNCSDGLVFFLFFFFKIQMKKPKHTEKVAIQCKLAHMNTLIVINLTFR